MAPRGWDVALHIYLGSTREQALSFFCGSLQPDFEGGGGGYTGFRLSIIPSVIPSVRPSVRHNFISTQYLENKLIEFH